MTKVLSRTDTIVIVIGSASENSLYQELKDLGPELHMIGDSLEPRHSLAAIHEGFKVGNLIPALADRGLEETVRGYYGQIPFRFGSSTGDGLPSSFG